MFCYNCGKELPDGVKFCPHCGSALEKSTSEKSLIPKNISNNQKIWLIICGIWLVVWFVLKALFFPDRQYDHYDRTVINVIALGIPVLASLIILLIQGVRTRRLENHVIGEKVLLVDFSKEFNNVRIDTIANKYTGATTRYCVFSKETRARFDERIERSMSVDEIIKAKSDLWVTRKINGEIIISKEKDSQ